MEIEQIDTDVLVIGTGIAGIRAALEVASAGKRAILVSKSPLGKATNTTLGGGGFACSTGDYTVEEHFNQTMNSGRMINDRTLVERFTSRAQSEIKALVGMGLEGEFHATGFRCITPFLIGGPMVTRALARAGRAAKIDVFENIMITDLIVSDEICRGALGFHKRRGNWYGFRAKTVILATGGAGGIYVRNDNAPGITGDGYALAMRAGLALLDMEFVQFYPLVYAGSGRTRMILLPLFADAGKIVNRKGEDLKEKYNLNKKPVALLSRDQLAQALFREIAAGNDIDGAIHLDILKGDPTELTYNDKDLARIKRKIAYDSAPVKIAPACHHTMGGLPIDADGRTALKGLYAAGEVAGGIHGANRMGGNAYSEGLVFGSVTGRAAADELASVPECGNLTSLFDDYAKKWQPCMTPGAAKQSTIPVVMADLKRTLWEKAGIVRNETLLKEGIDKTETIFHALESQYANTPSQLCRLIECANAALTGAAITVSAIERTESRGSHYRDDFPVEEGNWLKHIHVRLTDNRPVVSRIVPIDPEN
jgi:succinate dehydrogenase/fumarate reductase flavoprotein subunit